MTRAARILQGAVAVLVVMGVGALAYVAYAVVDAQAYQTRARARLVVEASLPMPVARVRQEGDPLGEIYSARIGLHAVIAEGESAAVLRRAVGHVTGTRLPGEVGNVVLAAHRDTFFRPLRNIRVGDIITVTDGGGAVHYEVEWTAVVPPDALSVLDPTEDRTLTLITCHPFSLVGEAPDRFVVRARAMTAAAQMAGDI